MIYFLIPSFNDSENFAKLLDNITNALKRKAKIFIIDDGSQDQTAKIIKKLSIKYAVQRIGYKKNRGPGYAFKFGFNFLIPKLKEKDIIVTMEADNTADFTILNRMISKSDNFDVILASPYANKGTFLGIGFNRKFLGYTASFLDQLIFRLKNVKTYSSFYRVYRASILIKAKEIYGNNFIFEDGFPAVVEFLIKLSKIGAKFCEIPAIIDWRNREGKSKMNIRKTTIRHLIIYKNYFSGKYNS